MTTPKLVEQLPQRGERSKVSDTLKTVSEQDFDEVVIIGYKNGKSYLHHSKIADTPKLIGTIEMIKYRLLEG